MRTYHIYKATNIVNGMSYIGQTVNYYARKRQHLACVPREDCKFHDAIKEYGEENFQFTVIDHAHSEERALELERKYIEQYDTYHNGYNMNKGGTGGFNASAVVCLELDGTYVCRYDSAAEAERDDGYCNSDVLLCCKGIISRCRDKVFMFEEDYLKNGPKTYVKPECAHKKAVIQCDLDGNLIAKYQSVKQAAESTGILRTRISSNLTGVCKTAGGFIFVYEGDYEKLDAKSHVPRKKGRKVAQIDPESGEVIEVFDRIADAGRKLGVSYKTIHKVVDMEGRKAYGYRWVSV